MLGTGQAEISGAIVRDGSDVPTLLLRVSQADGRSAQISAPVDRTVDRTLGAIAPQVVVVGQFEFV
jgi:hypothetical protein